MRIAGQEISKEHAKELEEGRQRMNAVRSRIEKYPEVDYPEEVQIEPVYEPAWSRKQWGQVQQVKAEVLHLTNKLNEHIDKSKKASKKYEPKY